MMRGNYASGCDNCHTDEGNVDYNDSNDICDNQNDNVNCDDNDIDNKDVDDNYDDIDNYYDNYDDNNHTDHHYHH